MCVCTFYFIQLYIFSAVCFQFLEILWENVSTLLEMEISERKKKQRDKNVGRKETFIHKFLGICLI